MERRIPVIVITGGPCSGKTTILSALRQEFADQICLVPEAATMLLEGGFPVPGKHLPWSEAWQATLQTAILPLQRALEDAYTQVAFETQRRLLICDRGLLDGAAYTPGGLASFADRYQVDPVVAVRDYHTIIHLESLATADPGKYGKAGNDSRFEPLERATQLEHATRAAWTDHPRRLIITGQRGIEGKVSEVIGITRFILAEGGLSDGNRTQI